MHTWQNNWPRIFNSENELTYISANYRSLHSRSLTMLLNYRHSLFSIYSNFHFHNECHYNTISSSGVPKQTFTLEWHGTFPLWTAVTEGHLFIVIFSYCMQIFPHKNEFWMTHY
jgi:hypothetical protein